MTVELPNGSEGRTEESEARAEKLRLSEQIRGEDAKLRSILIKLDEENLKRQPEFYTMFNLHIYDHNNHTILSPSL